MSRLSAADVVTLAGYGLGLWWSEGGPAWAGLASIMADELDGQLARAQGGSPLGSALDWGADIALTPLALARLGQSVDLPPVWFTAPAALAAQASLRAEGARPELGSVRAAVMLAAIVLEDLKGGRGR